MPRSAGIPKARSLAAAGAGAIPAFRGVKAPGSDRLVLSDVHGDAPAQ
jgi:hypothetical protein